MPIIKIGPKHQITIPKEIFDQLHLKPGDSLEAITQEGKIIMIPKQPTAKAPAPSLTKEEQEFLPEIKGKINKIQTDLVHSQGLSDEEIELAIKTDLIDPDQAWWWREEWQKGEREAEKEIAQRKVSGPFKNVDELIEHLQE